MTGAESYRWWVEPGFQGKSFCACLVCVCFTKDQRPREGDLVFLFDISKWGSSRSLITVCSPLSFPSTERFRLRILVHMGSAEGPGEKRQIIPINVVSTQIHA